MLIFQYRGRNSIFLDRFLSCGIQVRFFVIIHSLCREYLSRRIRKISSTTGKIMKNLNYSENLKKSSRGRSSFFGLSKILDFMKPSEDAEIINGSSAKVVVTNSGIKADTWSLITNNELTEQASEARKHSQKARTSKFFR